jgi:hypothetical protein
MSTAGSSLGYVSRTRRSATSVLAPVAAGGMHPAVATPKPGAVTAAVGAPIPTRIESAVARPVTVTIAVRVPEAESDVWTEKYGAPAWVLRKGAGYARSPSRANFLP